MLAFYRLVKSKLRSLSHPALYFVVLKKASRACQPWAAPGPDRTCPENDEPVPIGELDAVERASHGDGMSQYIGNAPLKCRSPRQVMKEKDSQKLKMCKTVPKAFSKGCAGDTGRLMFECVQATVRTATNVMEKLSALQATPHISSRDRTKLIRSVHLQDAGSAASAHL